MMVGESGTSSTNRKYHYYRCVNTKKYKVCNAKHKSVKKLPLENAVVNSVMAKIMDDNFVEYITDAVMDLQDRESSALPALRKQLEDAERGITNMLNAIQAGIINASTKQRLDELEDAKQMFSIIDSRYRCNKPLIVTTNLKLDELKRPPDLAHARIYDRILERCAPILFAGKNFREDNAASTKAAARRIVSPE